MRKFSVACCWDLDVLLKGNSDRASVINVRSLVLLMVAANVGAVAKD